MRWVALLCAWALSAPAQHLSPAERQANLDSFNYVWTTVRDKHWDPEIGGVDWSAVYKEFRPAIEKAETTEEARAVMSAMLGRLRTSHFAIIPADEYDSIEGTGTDSRTGTTGIDVRILTMERQTLVSSIEKGSPAEKAGVRPGWIIRTIAKQNLVPLMDGIAHHYPWNMYPIVGRRTVLARLDGPADQPVTVVFQDGAGRQHVVALKRGEHRGVLSGVGYMASTYVWLEATRRPDAIEYVRFNMFLDPERLMAAFGRSVDACGNCPGFIIDLRGNPGGLGAMAMGIAGWFVADSGHQLGTLKMRKTSLKFVVNPRPKTYAGPLAILVDETSASTSEILAAGLRDLGRARIFGEHTAGAALPSLLDRLPNGDGFQYAVADYISEGGERLEGRGVAPDVEASLTRAALLAGRDPALDAAVKWIKSQVPKATHE